MSVTPRPLHDGIGRRAVAFARAFRQDPYHRPIDPFPRFRCNRDELSARFEDRKRIRDGKEAADDKNRLLQSGGVSDALYDDARAQFTDKELVDLTIAVIAINAWNRLAVTFRPAVGRYKPALPTTVVSA